MPTNDLTYDKLMAVMAKFPTPEPSLFDSVFRPPRFMGMNVYEEPPPLPKIQVRDIKLSDGTPLLSREFLAETNAWFAKEFGYREPLCKDRAFMWNGGIMVSPKHAVMIRNLGA